MLLPVCVDLCRGPILHKLLEMSGISEPSTLYAANRGVTKGSRASVRITWMTLNQRSKNMLCACDENA